MERFFRPLMQDPIAGLATYVDESDGSEIPALVLPPPLKIPDGLGGVACWITSRDDPEDETIYLAVDILDHAGVKISPMQTILFSPEAGYRLQREGRLLIVDNDGGFVLLEEGEFRRAIDTWMQDGWYKQPPASAPG